MEANERTSSSCACGRRLARLDLELGRAFVISYSTCSPTVAGTSHAEHVDPGSDVTINLALSREGEVSGGELFLRLRAVAGDEARDARYVFARQRVGCALVHAGARPHGATRLVSGARSNLILWCRAQRTFEWTPLPARVQRRVVARISVPRDFQFRAGFESGGDGLGR